MAKVTFRDNLRLRKANIERLAKINSIIEEYAAQGYKLTLRQLYYQLVSRDIIPNVKQEYAKLSTLLVKGRMAGVVDWDAIEDRLRVPFLPYYAESVADAISDLAVQYRLDRQEGQQVYIEVWVEKDALSGVLRKITSQYHIRLMVNRGYSSCTAMFEAYKRFSRHDYSTILYLGDHDPSGLDMIRDIGDRLEGFGAYKGLRTLEVVHIAITTPQIQEHDPPPNPAKITDPRAKWYIQQHGNISWEVDALNPQVLNQLLKDNIEQRVDMDMFNVQLQQEEDDKKFLRMVAEKTTELRET